MQGESREENSGERRGRPRRSPRRVSGHKKYLWWIAAGAVLVLFMVAVVLNSGYSRKKRSTPGGKVAAGKSSPVTAPSTSPKTMPAEHGQPQTEGESTAPQEPPPVTVPVQDVPPPRPIEIFVVHCVDMEYVFIENQYCLHCSGRFRIHGQVSGEMDGKMVDTLTAACANCGEARKFYFDIGSFFGKPEQAKAFTETWKFLDSGIKAYTAGKMAEAEKALLEAVGREPSYAVAYLYLARINGDNDKPEQVVYWAQKANEIQPNDPAYYQLMAAAYEKMGNHSEAKTNSEIAANLVEREKKLSRGEDPEEKAHDNWPYEHPGTRLIFLVSMGGFERYDVEELSGELGTWIQYQKDETLLTVYVYEAPPEIEAPALEGDLPAAFRRHYDEVKAALRLGQQLLDMSIRFVSESRVQFLPDRNGPVAMRASFELEKDYGTDLYLCVVQDHFLKLRVTYPKSAKEQLTQDICTFMHELLGKGTATAGKKEIAGKQGILDAVEKFRKDPWNDAYAGEIILFSVESKDVTVYMTGETMRWAGLEKKDKTAAILNTAYIAGNIRAQLINGVCRNEGHAGVLMMFEIYKKLKKKQKDYRNQELEKLMKLEKAGKLKGYLAKTLPR